MARTHEEMLQGLHLARLLSPYSAITNPLPLSKRRAFQEKVKPFTLIVLQSALKITDVLIYDERTSGESGGWQRSSASPDAPDVGGALAFLERRAKAGTI
jgi:hypothetical protein